MTRTPRAPRAMLVTMEVLTNAPQKELRKRQFWQERLTEMGYTLEVRQAGAQKVQSLRAQRAKKAKAGKKRKAKKKAKVSRSSAPQGIAGWL